MPRIIKKQEVFLFEGISIQDIIKKEFLDKLKEKELDINPVTIVFMVSETKDKKSMVYPIIVSHESKKEIEKKVLHINMEKTDASENFVKILEELETK